MSASPDFEGVLRRLAESNVRFVLIGGLAMIAQGTANLTLDIDCLYDREPDNIKRISMLCEAAILSSGLPESLFLFCGRLTSSKMCLM